MGILVGEISRFVKTTSMRGVPRAAKADATWLRISWIIAVIFLLLSLMFNLYTLIASYLAYPVRAVLSEVTYDVTSKAELLPALTVCNHNAFSTIRSEVGSNVMSLSEYYQLIDEIPTQGLSNEQAANLRAQLKTPSAYIENIGLENATLIGHTGDVFIAKCAEIRQVGITLEERECSNLVQTTLQQQHEFFNCHRLHVTDDDTEGVLYGVSLVLYLDNFNTSETSDASDIFVQMANSGKSVIPNGGVAIPTQRDHNGYVFLEGLQISAGMSTSIKVALEERSRLSFPYGNCRHDDDDYDDNTCMAKCFQDGVRKKCNCMDSRAAIENPDDAEFCRKIEGSELDSTASQMAGCSAEEITDADKIAECLSDCPVPCHEYIYHPTISQSKWPNPTSMRAFYDKYIANETYEGYFSLVRQFLDGDCVAGEDCYVKYMLSQRMLEDNFLELKLHLADHRYFPKPPSKILKRGGRVGESA